MDWILVAILMIFLWMISLYKVFSSSCVPRRPALLSAGSSTTTKRWNVLLVLAHPDDESISWMKTPCQLVEWVFLWFFTPTILFLISEGHNLHILCLSTGNADGKGNVRKEELYQACAVLKVPLSQVKILDHPDFQDGFNRRWDHQLLATIVEEEVKTRGIDSLITFDKYGVSGHCNHCDVHHGVCMLLCKNSQRNIEAWELISSNILRKYSGPVDIWLSILYSWYKIGGQLYCLPNSSPWKTYLAMAEHKSQWVWFRKLFVLFSSYTYVNTLRKINF